MHTGAMALHRDGAPARGNGPGGRAAAVLGALSVVLVLVAVQSVGRAGLPADALLEDGTHGSLAAEIQQAEQLIAPETAGPASVDDAERGAVREAGRYDLTDYSVARKNAAAAGAQVDALTDDELRANIARLEGDLHSPVKKGAMARAKRAAAADLKKSPDAGASGFRSLLLKSLAAIESELTHRTEESRVQKALHEMTAIQSELGGLRSRIHGEQRVKEALKRRLRNAKKQKVAREATVMKRQAAMQKDMAELRSRVHAETKVARRPEKHKSHAGPDTHRWEGKAGGNAPPFPPTVAVYVQAPPPQVEYVPEQYFAAPQPHMQFPSPQLAMHFQQQQQPAPLQAERTSEQLAVASTSPFAAARAAFKEAVASFSGAVPRVQFFCVSIVQYV